MDKINLRPILDNSNSLNASLETPTAPTLSDDIVVPFVCFSQQYEDDKADILACVDRVFSNGVFVGASAIVGFETAIAEYCGVQHAVGVGSGTDALFLSMIALGIGAGDEVITPPNSHFSSTSSIIHAGAIPVFADVGPDQNFDLAAVEAAITPNTAAIMPVHLTGRIADMDGILGIADKFDLKVIEDSAQAIGADMNGKKAGSFGDIAAFSAHPLKNLNAAGDAGFITTNDTALADRITLLRNNGLEGRETVLEWGYASRMDVLQAEILAMRLPKLEGIIQRRRKNAEIYMASLDKRYVFWPASRSAEMSVYHNFVIQVDDRESLKKYLFEHGVQSAIHYLVPIHLQPAAESLGYGRGDFPIAEKQADRILSLPINQFLTRDQLELTAHLINGYFHKRR
jgi:dTDP-4-amino-4,6-dideoxygalactose transaminase